MRPVFLKTHFKFSNCEQIKIRESNLKNSFMLKISRSIYKYSISVSWLFRVPEACQFVYKIFKPVSTTKFLHGTIIHTKAEVTYIKEVLAILFRAGLFLSVAYPTVANLARLGISVCC